MLTNNMVGHHGDLMGIKRYSAANRSSGAHIPDVCQVYTRHTRSEPSFTGPSTFGN